MIPLLALAMLAGCDEAPVTPDAPARACEVPEAGRRGHEAEVMIEGGVAELGSVRFHEEERPLRRVAVRAFAMDRFEVTNRQFAAFVAATGHVTTAERLGGGAVFVSPLRVWNMEDISQWWRIDPAADWRHPHGAGSAAVPDHPVVQVSIEDARAYAAWAGRALPDEAEWEHAARGGLRGRDYGWGDDRARAVEHANHWQGVFPLLDAGNDGYKGLAPVGCFKPDGHGLHDMAGNVWEWTETAWDRADGAAGASVIKGGSWLCADNFCLRYRPAARQPGDPELPTDHIGFRTIRRLDSGDVEDG